VASRVGRKTAVAVSLALAAACSTGSNVSAPLAPTTTARPSRVGRAEGLHLLDGCVDSLRQSGIVITVAGLVTQPTANELAGVRARGISGYTSAVASPVSIVSDSNDILGKAQSSLAPGAAAIAVVVSGIKHPSGSRSPVATPVPGPNGETDILFYAPNSGKVQLSWACSG